jgi:ABC-type phosphate transport system permease subunit
VAVASGEAVAVGTDARREVTWWLTRDGVLHQRASEGPSGLIAVTDRQRVVAADHEVGGLLSVLSEDGAATVGRVRVVRPTQGEGPIPAVQWRPVAAWDPQALYPGAVGITANSDGEGNLLAALWHSAELRLARWHGEQWEHRPGPSVNGVGQVAIADGLENLAVVDGSGVLKLYRASDLAERRVLGIAMPVERVRFLIGGRSLVAAGRDGSVSVLLEVPLVAVTNLGVAPVQVDSTVFPPGKRSVVPDDDVAYRLARHDAVRVERVDPVWQVVRSLPAMTHRPTAIAPSYRDRGFMVGDVAGHAALYNATSGRRLLHGIWGDGPLSALAMVPRGNGAVAVLRDTVVSWSFSNPPPEISVRTLFSPVWYEGYAAPRHVWQTSGGSDDFEPKFGLWPLLFGTLKATLYAMVVSAPLALLAALYVSQLAPSWLQGVVKPAVELMAAVPSVVVGFLAALWLAPRLELWLFPSLVAAVAVPGSVVVALVVLRMLPAAFRRRIPRGGELLVLLASGFLIVAAAVLLAGPLEGWLFDGDFQRFLFGEWGVRYDQRNALVVGLALGFAVIPVIFTIAEDACSGVPATLIQAARALGATRWQAAVRLVVPAASPGLFAAVMLGLGRAVGETMIVLMAAGNTPILDVLPFNGMRTMSAAIAFEIPEAPVAGTLFRVLFLTGLLLFALSLVFTATADAVGRRLRRRYARF